VPWPALREVVKPIQSLLVQAPLLLHMHWSGFIFFFRHGGAMTWHGWSSVFQDSVKNMAPRSWVKSPNGF